MVGVSIIQNLFYLNLFPLLLTSDTMTFNTIKKIEQFITQTKKLSSIIEGEGAKCIKDNLDMKLFIVMSSFHV